jgi:hypothetical protein
MLLTEIKHMADIDSEVIVRLDGFKKYRKALQPGSEFWNKFFKRASIRIRSWAQERFDKFSRGGGDWPPLSPRTKRKRGDTSKASILRDTNTLFRVLTPVFIKSPGAVEDIDKDGVKIGFGGPSKHPNARVLTIGQLAAIHHFGRGRVPVRKLLVEPPKNIVDAIEGDFGVLEKKLRNQTELPK